MSLKAFILSLVVVFGAASAAAAQSDAATRFRAKYGYDCCRNYSEYAEYCVMQGGTPSPNPPTCSPGSGRGTGVPESRLSLKGSPASALIRSGIIGGLFGMTLGSLAKDPGGNPQWQSGGNLGAGLMIMVAVGANSGQWGRPANAFVTGMGGAFIGAAVGQATDAGVIGGKDPVYEPEESKIVPYAAAGAGAGLAMGLLFPGRSNFGLIPRGRVSSFQRGSITGLRISW